LPLGDITPPKLSFKIFLYTALSWIFLIISIYIKN
jgi:hypothetical protein